MSSLAPTIFGLPANKSTASRGMLAVVFIGSCCLSLVDAAKEDTCIVCHIDLRPESGVPDDCKEDFLEPDDTFKICKEGHIMCRECIQGTIDAKAWHAGNPGGKPGSSHVTTVTPANKGCPICKDDIIQDNLPEDLQKQFQKAIATEYVHKTTEAENLAAAEGLQRYYNEEDREIREARRAAHSPAGHYGLPNLPDMATLQALLNLSSPGRTHNARSWEQRRQAREDRLLARALAASMGPQEPPSQPVDGTEAAMIAEAIRRSQGQGMPHRSRSKHLKRRFTSENRIPNARRNLDEFITSMENDILIAHNNDVLEAARILKQMFQTCGDRDQTLEKQKEIVAFLKDPYNESRKYL